MRIPMLSKKETIQGVQYGTTVVIRYVLPKRELVKIAAVVIATEMLLHAPVRRAWIDKVEKKVDHWIGDVVDTPEDPK